MKTVKFYILMSLCLASGLVAHDRDEYAEAPPASIQKEEHKGNSCWAKFKVIMRVILLKIT